MAKPSSGEPAYPARREAVFHPEFREDLRYWVDTDRKLALRCLDLIEAVVRDPFAGIGKPEPLKYLGAGVWSRRLSQEHRIVYAVAHKRIDFLQARYHYGYRIWVKAVSIRPRSGSVDLLPSLLGGSGIAG